MRSETALRLSVESARRAAAGDLYAHELAEGLQHLIGADAGVSCTEAFLHGVRAPRFAITVNGIPPLTPEYLQSALPFIPDHPSFNGISLRGPGWTHRLSDFMEPAAYWDLPAYQAVHGFNGGRYAAGLRIHESAGHVVFLGLIRTDKDFSDREIELLSIIREPLASAVRFRTSLDAAVERLAPAPEDPVALSRRETEVLALIARGWTRWRVARQLQITERTVRKHLENVTAKTGIETRAETIAWWVRRGGLVR